MNVFGGGFMGKEYDKKYINDVLLDSIVSEWAGENKFLDIADNIKLIILGAVRHALSRSIIMHSDGADGEKNISRRLLRLGEVDEVPPSVPGFMSIGFLLDCLKMRADRIVQSFSGKGVHIPAEPLNLRQEYLEMIASSTQILIHEAADSLCGLSATRTLVVSRSIENDSDFKPKSILKPRN